MAGAAICAANRIVDHEQPGPPSIRLVKEMNRFLIWKLYGNRTGKTIWLLVVVDCAGVCKALSFPEKVMQQDGELENSIGKDDINRPSQASATMFSSSNAESSLS